MGHRLKKENKLERQYKVMEALFEPEFIAQFLEWLLRAMHDAQLSEREWIILGSSGNMNGRH